MNTLFHVVDEESDLVATVLFRLEPQKVLGSEPVVGKKVLLGPPFSEAGKEVPYVIVAITEEDEEGDKACALRLKPQRAYN